MEKERISKRTSEPENAFDIVNRSQEALRRSEAELRNIFESLNDSLYIINMEGGILDTNRTGHERLGYTKEELLGMSIADIDLPEFASRIPERMEQIKKEGKAVFESAHVRKDGSVVSVEVNSKVIEYRGERVFLSVVRDITDRKQMEHVLQDSIVTARTLLDTQSAAALLVDRAGVCIDANETFANRFSKKVSDVIGNVIWDFFPPEVAARRRTYFARVLRTKRQVRFEDERQGMWNDIIVTPILDSCGEVSKAVVFGFDITRRKQIENELKEYRDRLEELVEQRAGEIEVLHDQLRQSQKLEAIGLLAGGIAHDFSNILSTIKGSLYLISMSLEKGSPLLTYAERALSSMDKATNLTQSLLAFSRKQTVTLKPWNFDDIIRGAATLLSQLIGEHIEIRMMLSDRKVTVMADRSQIEQVLLNLATNARDAMPDGGELAVQTRVIEMDDAFRSEHGYGAAGQYVLLEVSDTGAGMDKGTREKIFEPFFTTKELNKGSGLGLAVTYGIVKQHGGFIDVDTFPGRGTTFRIYLPVSDAQALAPESPEVSSAEGRGETILLAEDDAAARGIMAEVLRLAGYAVIEASDGEDAVRLFKDQREGVDLIFADVRMPKRNGREVYGDIKKIKPGAKFLFTSGYTDEIISSQGVLSEGFNFISKAALPGEILLKIRSVLDN